MYEWYMQNVVTTVSTCFKTSLWPQKRQRTIHGSLQNTLPKAYGPCQVRVSRVASLFSYRRTIPIQAFRLHVSWRIPAPGDHSHMHTEFSVHPIKEKTLVERWQISNWLWDNVTSRVICTLRVGNPAPLPGLCGQSPDRAEEMPRP